MYFEAFRESDYRRFWTAQFISNIGSWMQNVAQGWLVYRLTDSAFLLGFVGFASSVPALVLMLPGGVLADQLNRKRVVAVSQIAQALCALFLALSIRANRITVWQIVAAAVVVGIAQSFSAPAFQAMIIDLLEERSRLANAIAMNSLQFNFSRVIGPILAGATLSAWGSFWCFLINALSFLPLVWVLVRTKNRQVPLQTSAALLSRLAEGFRFVRRDRVAMLLLAVVAAASLFGYPYLNLMPVLARALFTDDAVGMGYLMSGVGAGALAGALALSLRTPRRAIPVIVGSIALFGAALSGAALVRSAAAVIPLFVICGATMVISFALCNTTIQQRVPDELRGRVLSMYTFAFFAFIPFGNLAAGIVAEHRGIAAALMMLGGGMLLSAALAAFALRGR
ncbi:MAG: MFS transporter [Thermoanaerobaculia bacterium]|nr:MFS transporter [Thermoanaerobaculia bacterium]